MAREARGQRWVGSEDGCVSQRGGHGFSPGPSGVNSLVIYLAAPASLTTAHSLLGGCEISEGSLRTTESILANPVIVQMKKPKPRSGNGQQE